MITINLPVRDSSASHSPVQWIASKHGRIPPPPRKKKKGEGRSWGKKHQAASTHLNFFVEVGKMDFIYAPLPWNILEQDFKSTFRAWFQSNLLWVGWNLLTNTLVWVICMHSSSVWLSCLLYSPRVRVIIYIIELIIKIWWPTPLIVSMILFVVCCNFFFLSLAVSNVRKMQKRKRRKWNDCSIANQENSAMLHSASCWMNSLIAYCQ